MQGGRIVSCCMCVQSVVWYGGRMVHSARGLTCTLFVWCECECKFGRRMG